MKWILTAMLMVLMLLAIGCGSILYYPVPPIAEAGPDQTVKVEGKITFDASESYDPDGGEIVKYVWTVVGVPEGHEEELGKVIADTEEAVWTTTWTVDESTLGSWLFELIVTDDDGNRAADQMVVTVVE
ncbi:MAG: hypothetical protein ACE5NP_04830 [Anaerolineae bacterium]